MKLEFTEYPNFHEAYQAATKTRNEFSKYGARNMKNLVNVYNITNAAKQNGTRFFVDDRFDLWYTFTENGIKQIQRLKLYTYKYDRFQTVEIENNIANFTGNYLIAKYAMTCKIEGVYFYKM